MCSPTAAGPLLVTPPAVVRGYQSGVSFSPGDTLRRWRLSIKATFIGRLVAAA
jgi:hypothetical protein